MKLEVKTCLYTFIFSIVNLCFVLVSGICLKTEFRHVSALQDVYVNEGLIENFVNHANSIQCSKKCINNILCVSFFHNSLNSTCGLYSVTFITSPNYVYAGQKITDIGSKYYIMQDANRECTDYVWDRELNKCYFFYKDTPALFQDASNDCFSKGESLLKIDTERFQEKLTTQIQSNGGTNQGGYMIGATDSVVEGTWRWEDGTIATANQWRPDYPKNQNAEQDYMLLAKGGSWKWQDITDGPMLRNYICERPIRIGTNYNPL